MEQKRENFKRISENRVSKIVDAISKLHNLSNTSFYEYTEEEIDSIFETIQTALDKQRDEFEKIRKKGHKKIEL